MLNSAGRAVGRTHITARNFHSSEVQWTYKQVTKEQTSPHDKHATEVPYPVQKKPERIVLSRQRKDAEDQPVRNEVGVQLLSRKLHSQIFRNTSLPPPDKTYVRIARDHLEAHGLDPTQGSILPDTGFTLPPMQGRTIDEHFYRIGNAAAQPWLAFAKDFAHAQPPPKPDCWRMQPGWTKYHHRSDGSSYGESVPAPDEDMISFDVETMPNYHNYAVMACAMSSTHWYSWISPWLLGHTDNPQHLISLGDPTRQRIVVGHNVSYDRARVLEEYSIKGTKTRFLDTMALHVAVKGISSHQRPAWMKYRKAQKDEKERKEEAFEVAVDVIRKAELQQVDAGKRAELQRLRREIEDSLPQLQLDDTEDTAAETSSKRWEDITSANSLADVAKLHCNIEMDKEIRNDFMTHTPAEILANVHDYLDYCANDVHVTHSVFAAVLPQFLAACPNPVSFAGILTMGSSFLTVDQEWEAYLEKAEGKYRELEEDIKKRLLALAEKAKDMVVDESWRNDEWLSQLDWTPKVPGKSRGVEPPPKQVAKLVRKLARQSSTDPAWYDALRTLGPLHSEVKKQILPFLFQLSCDDNPLQYSAEEGWTYVDANGCIKRPGPRTGKKVQKLLGKTVALKDLQSGHMSSPHHDLAVAVARGDESETIKDKILRLAEDVLNDSHLYADNPWMSQLDWTRSQDVQVNDGVAPQTSSQVTWPKWYWELAKPKKDMPPGTVDITVRNRISPLLLRLSWQGWPLFHSREYGWTFRVPADASYESRQKPVTFFDKADVSLQNASENGDYLFYKLPHKDGESANVGSPLSKTFIKYAQDGTLTSPGDEAKDALDMNAQCSYWISSRDRILKQMVLWQDSKLAIGFSEKPGEKWGMILPALITMGTVTRRAIEKTWLTASNAKKNRVGSELKALVHAPPGYALVGADVDSEELWISSVMGDAQLGLHGATAIGWMTLEGTKAAGTDLHSKTANILGITRDQAKIFNYSRIYGAGMRHAVLLLLQSNASMKPEDAQKQAQKLYSSTKGKNTHRSDLFGRKFWFGGTESFVFNKLEEIALSDRPQTPALGCGITYALSKEYLSPGFGTDYMTSRINWVVQSSGVDYLHLLIVAMDHLITKYNIDARYLISVHDELRYLVAEHDKYRAALALQIANLWTRSLFAYRLGMDDLPQGVAFFSAVDIDTVLRKEVDLPCVTPSQPIPIPSGESLNIVQVLQKTNQGSLREDGQPMQEDGLADLDAPEGYIKPDRLAHRSPSAAFLRAQATTELGELRRLAELQSGLKYPIRSMEFARRRNGQGRRKINDGIPQDSDHP
ncbi:gamma DNA-directed DNA polymerase [Rickenella mellea]|uniref:Mitochondrial DNA polymerase catalytic subunit n=1 Tax=Rickenella mellea TaxID=50990 RepID=A0A4Y7QK72_9AGAM|nr:gamma DNA-directed DNA polymerase [Rickenella mellea]